VGNTVWRTDDPIQCDECPEKLYRSELHWVENKLVCYRCIHWVEKEKQYQEFLYDQSDDLDEYGNYIDSPMGIKPNDW